MLFRIITIVSVLGIIGRLTYLRFLRKLMISGISPGKPLSRAYASWLGRRLSELIQRSPWLRLQAVVKHWIDRSPLLWIKWVVAGVGLSFSYLALSGFAFAIFTTRGIFGLSLLIHVIAGGIFAVCLTIVLFFRAKKYAFLAEKAEPLWPLTGTLSKILARLPFRSILFWLFILSGLFLEATALFSMLPYFSFKTQLWLVEAHRYSALAALLTAIVLLDTIILPRDKQ
jgi:hypothetical protein